LSGSAQAQQYKSKIQEKIRSHDTNNRKFCRKMKKYSLLGSSDWDDVIDNRIEIHHPNREEAPPPRPSLGWSPPPPVHPLGEAHLETCGGPTWHPVGGGGGRGETCLGVPSLPTVKWPNGQRGSLTKGGGVGPAWVSHPCPLVGGANRAGEPPEALGGAHPRTPLANAPR
jgi:hypothetical protein